MLKNLFIALAVAGVALIVALILFGGGDDPLPELASTPTGTEESAPVDPLVGVEPPVDVTEADLGIPTTDEPVIDLGQGPSGVSGVVHGTRGAVEAGAVVTLYASRLDEIESTGGAPIFDIIDRNFMRGPGGRGGGGGGVAISSELRESLDPVARVRSGGDGEYSFVGLPAGSYLVGGYSQTSLVTPAARISRPTDDAGDVSDLFLLEAGFLAGRVLDPTGSPVADAQLRVVGELMDPSDFRGGGGFLSFEEIGVLLLNGHEYDGTTASDGGFRFPRLPRLTYDVVVIAPPWAETEVRQSVPHDDELEIVLGDGAGIVGRVIDEKGAGLPGIELSTSPEDGGMMSRFRGLQRRRTATTDGQGNFRMLGLAPGTYRLQAEGPGYQSKSEGGIALTAREETAVEMVLAEGAVISGVVRNEAGDPVRDVRVSARSERGGRGGGRGGRGGFDPAAFGGGSSTQSDSSGRFVLDRLEPGEYSVSARKDGFVTLTRTASTGEKLDLTLENGLSVAGRIVDPQGEPIARADVSVGRGFGTGRRTQSDVAGRFVLAGLERSPIDLRIRVLGFQNLDLELDPGDAGDIVLDPAVVLSGIVLDPDGQPVAGARVRASFSGEGDSGQGPGGRRGGRGGRGNNGPGGNRGGGRAATAWADGDGAYRVQLPEPSGTYDLVASSRGHLDGRLDAVQVDGRDVAGLDLRLSRAGEVWGLISDGGGHPISGADVSLFQTGQRNFRLRGGGMARTDAEGRYQILGVAPGDYGLRISARGFANFSTEGITLGEGAVIEQSFSLEPEQRLVGVVVDSYGVPIEGARLRLRGESGGFQGGQTNSAGSFDIGGLSAEVLSISVTRQGFRRKDVRDVLPSPVPLTITMDTAYELRGMVRDAGTGEPIAGARVQVTEIGSANPDDADPRQGRGRRGGRGPGDRTDAEGLFTVGELVDGAYEVTVEANGYMTQTVGPIHVPGVQSERVDVAMLPGARILGVVLEGGGTPVAGARIEARRLQEPVATDAAPDQAPRSRRVRPITARSGDDGRFQVDGLTDGLYELTIRHDEFLTVVWKDSVEVITGEVGEDLRVSVERGAELSGQILNRSGFRVTEGRLSLDGGDPVERRRVNVAADGTYFVGGLTPGSYTINYYADGSREPSFTDTLELRKQQRVTRNLSIE